MSLPPAVRRLGPALAAILILAAGCADVSPIAPSSEPRPESIALAKTASGAKAKVAKLKHEAGTYARVIGPKGGKLKFGIGELDVPRGAVDRPILFTARTNGEDLGVEFGPHGTVFNRGAEPELRFELSGAGKLHGAQIVYVGDDGTVIERILTVFDNANRSASARIQHFSKLLLATN